MFQVNVKRFVLDVLCILQYNILSPYPLIILKIILDVEKRDGRRTGQTVPNRETSSAV